MFAVQRIAGEAEIMSFLLIEEMEGLLSEKPETQIDLSMSKIDRVLERNLDH